MRRSFPDGVCGVFLAEVGHPGLVALTVMEAMGLCAMDTDPATVLVGLLADKRILLVLDNSEHLIQSCAELAAAVLPACPRKRVLATSREGLDVAGERVFLVSPLPVPDPEADGPGGTGAGVDAVTLFAERAATVAPGFSLTSDNRAAVATLCRHLDGLPLTIELAAVRMRLLTVEDLLRSARQDKRYRV